MMSNIDSPFSFTLANLILCEVNKFSGFSQLSRRLMSRLKEKTIFLLLISASVFFQVMDVQECPLQLMVLSQEKLKGFDNIVSLSYMYTCVIILCPICLHTLQQQQVKLTKFLNNFVIFYLQGGQQLQISNERPVISGNAPY